MPKWTRLLSLILVIVALGAVFACGDDDDDDDDGPAATTPATTATGGASPTDSAPSGEPITIGYLGGDTGYLSALDTAIKDAIQIAIDQANASGGVLGRPVELASVDNKGDPQAHVTGLSELTSDGIDVLTSGCLSAGTPAISATLLEKKLPLVTCTVLPANTDPGYPYMFSAVPDVRAAIQTLFTYLEGEGLTNVAILHDPTPYATGTTTLAESLMADYGLTLVSKEQYTPTDSDFKAILLKSQQEEPDVIYQIGAGPSTGIISKNMAELGLDVPHVADVAIIPQEVADIAGSDAENIIFPALDVLRYDLLASGPEKDRITPFIDAWREAYDDRDPNWASIGYDAANMIFAAIEEAGSTDGEAVRDALESQNYAGVRATYELTPEKHTGAMRFTIVRVHADGSIEDIE